jgi:hypothetical protein
MSSVFYGDGSIRSGFASRTLPGLALYLLIYTSLGSLFACMVAGRLSRLGTFLLGILFAVTWYFLSFQLLWKSMMPLVALLHSAQPTAIGHVIYGSLLARYPVYLPQAAPPPAEPEEQAAAADGSSQV